MNFKENSDGFQGKSSLGKITNNVKALCPDASRQALRGVAVGVEWAQRRVIEDEEGCNEEPD